MYSHKFKIHVVNKKKKKKKKKDKTWPCQKKKFCQKLPSFFRFFINRLLLYMITKIILSLHLILLTLKYLKLKFKINFVKNKAKFQNGHHNKHLNSEILYMDTFRF